MKKTHKQVNFSSHLFFALSKNRNRFDCENARDLHALDSRDCTSPNEQAFLDKKIRQIQSLEY